ncbi:protein PELOTA 2-like isoform X2 [Hordeum vulgare subsp. vulgare]|uniref:protein PELOTA 2-like isoform X2 n=1 Tax=Hordeum vulgare subsp. vulgare TaxID=112509 RepID=UPI001D1A3891|nr:protein PELOTA 2-like isoform X2 [Hordeum vulgare subsp. vulgare]
MLSMATRDPAATVTSVVDLAWSGLEGDRMRSHNRERRASPFADQLQRGVFVFYHRHSLKEVLDTPGVMSLIKDTKAAQEVQALKEFFAMLTNMLTIPPPPHTHTRISDKKNNYSTDFICL